MRERFCWFWEDGIEMMIYLGLTSAEFLVIAYLDPLD